MFLSRVLMRCMCQIRCMVAFHGFLHGANGLSREPLWKVLNLRLVWDLTSPQHSLIWVLHTVSCLRPLHSYVVLVRSVRNAH